MSFLSIWFNHPKRQTAEHKRELRAALVQWAYALSPVFAFDEKPEWILKSKDSEHRRLFCGLSISLAGSVKLHGGYECVLRMVQEFMGQRNLSYRAAIAPTVGAAWALSRFGDDEQCVIAKRDLYEKALPLPLLALRISPQTISALHEVNVQTIAELVALSRSSLFARYGAELLQRIDQLFGAVEEPIKKEELPFSLTVERNFPSPVLEIEAVLNSGNKLLLFLLRKLYSEHKLPAHLLVEIDIVRLPRFSSEIKISNPTGAARHLLSLLKTRLEKLDLGVGVLRLALTVQRTVPVAARQILSKVGGERSKGGASSGVEDPLTQKERLGMLFDLLGEKLGGESVRRVAFRESYVPERSFELVPAALNVAERAPIEISRVNAAVAADPHVCDERPSVLFALPHPVDVMSVLPDNPPFWLKWRGKTYRIKHAVGPERITPEWWGRDPQLLKARDYFRVQLASGIWLWLFRELNTLRWFVHGVW